MAALTVLAPAKVNLYLGVHAQRDGQGYHRVDSVMAALDCGDVVTVEDASSLVVSCDPPVDARGEATAAHRAAELLAQALGRAPRCSVRILRRIPERSGLGGSSTDAGAVLRALCQLWGVDPEDPRVVRVAQDIGADVAFFLDPRVSYLAGRGDVLVRHYPTPQVALAVVRADVRGATAGEAYAAFDRDPQEPGDLRAVLGALESGDAAGLAAAACNNLSPAVYRLDAGLADVVSWLRGREGVLNALVSGSGACCYAFCADERASQRVVRDAHAQRNWWAKSAKLIDAAPNFC